MKKLALCGAILFVMAAGVAAAVDVSGEFSTEARALFSDWSFSFNEEHGSLSFDQQVDENLYAKVKLGVRYFGFPIGSSSSNILTTADLGVLSFLSPLEISLEEAYFTYSNFIFNGLDLSVGAQRIPWGAADTLNPTDLLNPLDLSDPLDFGKRSASLAASLTYTFPVLDSSLQIVYEPYSQVARLNGAMIRQIGDALYAETSASLVDSTPGWESQSVETPAWTLSNFLLGARLSASIVGFDLSLSYINRLNDIPYVKEVDLHLTDMGATITENDYTLGCYREQAIGFDLAKDLGFVLVWGEVSVVFPEEAATTIKTYLDSIPLPDTTSTAVSSDPYAKFTAGASQKIGPFYFNIQYNQGFFHEQGYSGQARLQDYAVLRLELSLLSDKLKIGASGIGNVNTLGDAFTASNFGEYVADNYGVMGGLDIAYSPSPNMSFSTGVMIFDGTDTTTLGAWRDNDLAFVKFTYSF
jgi:hypothetical protein